jgi:hypothetical protein
LRVHLKEKHFDSSVNNKLFQLSLLNPAPGTSHDLIKSYSARSKQSMFNLAHFLGSFGAYTYVEGTKKRTQAIC